MKIELIADFKYIYLKLWSVRFTIFSGLFAGLEVILPLFESAIPRGIFAGLSVLTAIASAVSRGIAQKELYSEPKE